ncbi:M3 family oligoendopeptidase [Sphingomonas azotifigens]|uniref:M3 family oligoendopeptidase n=1 Tax=Sphingomonas azotifigens TaxID=330920 RepID=UPI000A0333AD|nr:M3 family oligoendopeptidase [Sphingomonas azotifigens]
MIDVSRRATLCGAGLFGLTLALPTRAGQADAASWDLTDLYPDPAAWNIERKRVEAALPRFATYKGRLAESAGLLAEALVLQSDIERALNRLYVYARLKADEDTRIAAHQERRDQADTLWDRFDAARAWIAPELLAIDPALLRRFVADDATLKARFDFYLEDLARLAPHTLSREGEAVLALAGPLSRTPSDVVGLMRASDIAWPSLTLSSGKQLRLNDQGFTQVRELPDRGDRKAGFDTFFGANAAFQNSIGAAYAGQVRASIFTARARNYPNALAAALSAHDIPEAVYRTLIAETNKGLPQLHRYFALRRRMLKLPDIGYWDLYPPIVTLDRRFSLAEMRALTLAAVRPLGPDFQARIAAATAARWIDPLPRPGKAPAGYMMNAYRVHPYVLLNIGEGYDGLTTYAHEWGHGVHSLLADAHQPYEKASYPTFLAEIASTLNEQLLARYLLQQARTKEEKLFFLGSRLENLRFTYFRQVMFAEFEATAHAAGEAGEGLSGERFTRIYGDLLRRYHGPDLQIDTAYATEWAYVPHFFNAPFYVYQYATSLSAAVAFSDSILTGGEAERDRYLAVLKAGGSRPPLEILRRAGLDMTSPAPYQALIATFRETIDQVEALLA